MLLGTFKEADGTVLAGEVAEGAVRVLEAKSMIDWLAGKGRAASGREIPLSELETLAPVPNPPAVRDFYAYEEHVASGARRRGTEIAPYWYEAPAFYFSNPASILGPGDQVRKPDSTSRLDFELEIAAIVGKPVGAEQKDELGIVGFTLLNDWSARDIQVGEMTVLLGPHKAKDFGTSLGPYIVTADSLPFDGDRLYLTAAVELDGDIITESDAALQHFGWTEMVEHARRGTRLRPGDVLGSGTLGRGCLLELGPLPIEGSDEGRWLERGDVVTLRCPELGRLTNTVS